MEVSIFISRFYEYLSDSGIFLFSVFFFLIWLHFRSEFRQDRDYEARKKCALFENVRIFLIAMYNKIWISNYL